ncbi:hypothetical protein [Spongiactinospora gelatinilytica]|uniref:hypothetical protein n=1 Tax=Spongiactinospora gelatinilytica TaxID=2666298 RepID=UPI001314D4CF|nr:hypothetical protein [Spongiactinospora gelatinilytica]
MEGRYDDRNAPLVGDEKEDPLVPRQRDDLPPEAAERARREEGPGPVYRPEEDAGGLPGDAPGEVRQGVEPEAQVPPDRFEAPGRKETAGEDTGVPMPGEEPRPGAHAMGPAETSGQDGEIPEPAEPGEHGQPAAGLTAADLFGQDAAEIQRRWRDVQATFVDDPRLAVERADGLFGEVVAAMREALDSRADRLHEQWTNTAESDTERLRLALRDYRATLEHLLHLTDQK